MSKTYLFLTRNFKDRLMTIISDVGRICRVRWWRIHSLWQNLQVALIASFLPHDQWDGLGTKENNFCPWSGGQIWKVSLSSTSHALYAFILPNSIYIFEFHISCTICFYTSQFYLYSCQSCLRRISMIKTLSISNII